MKWLKWPGILKFSPQNDAEPTHPRPFGVKHLAKWLGTNPFTNSLCKTFYVFKIFKLCVISRKIHALFHILLYSFDASLWVFVWQYMLTNIIPNNTEKTNVWLPYDKMSHYIMPIIKATSSSTPFRFWKQEVQDPYQTKQHLFKILQIYHMKMCLNMSKSIWVILDDRRRVMMVTVPS